MDVSLFDGRETQSQVVFLAVFPGHPLNSAILPHHGTVASASLCPPSCPLFNGSALLKMPWCRRPLHAVTKRPREPKRERMRGGKRQHDGWINHVSSIRVLEPFPNRHSLVTQLLWLLFYFVVLSLFSLSVLRTLQRAKRVTTFLRGEECFNNFWVVFDIIIIIRRRRMKKVQWFRKSKVFKK